MGIFYRDVSLILSIRRLNEFLGHFSLSWNSYNVQTDKINRMPFVIRMLKARLKKYEVSTMEYIVCLDGGLKSFALLVYYPANPVTERKIPFFIESIWSLREHYRIIEIVPVTRN